MLNFLRNILWRILGISYEHIQKIVDKTFLQPKNGDIIGVNSYHNHAIVHRWSSNNIQIGKYCSISYDVRFICDDGKHLYNTISNYPFNTNKISTTSNIIIGNDVWIGLNAVILPGVRIGDGATIAAGAVVTKDVMAYTLVGGCPAKVISEKCTREDAKKMSEIAWWNWDENTIKARINDFRLSFPEFIAKYGHS